MSTARAGDLLTSNANMVHTRGAPQSGNSGGFHLGRILDKEKDVPRSNGSGTITGILQDSNGVMPAARVLLVFDGNATDRRTAITRTDAAGRYTFSGLSPGNYVVLPFDPEGEFRTKAIHTVVP